jgi:tRNA threonylcarbamoyladenosine biosynthesis protein TsaE
MASRIFKRNEIASLAHEILEKHQGVIALSGPLGAGKTTLTKEIAKQLGITENVISPTYVLETEYKIPGSDKLFIHIDCYRMETVDELIRLGIENRINQKNIIVIEWADKFPEFFKRFPTTYVNISLTESDDERVVLVTHP